jgi:hypothetical protein
MGRSKGSRLKGWIESPNALRWRLDLYYAAPLPRQSREKSRILKERRSVRKGVRLGRSGMAALAPQAWLLSLARAPA